jgi:hypothetical protein
MFSFCLVKAARRQARLRITAVPRVVKMRS